MVFDEKRVAVKQRVNAGRKLPYLAMQAFSEGCWPRVFNLLLIIPA
jgi:hypothetical protein